MDTATITLLLGGHAGNSIQKFGVTAGEIAVLQLIHGNESVRDVEWTGDIQRSHRAEIERLHNVYGANDGNGRAVSKAVASLFPGAAARVFEKLTELELDGEFVKSLGPVEEKKAPAPAEQPANDVEDLSKLTKVQLLQLASERSVDVSQNDNKAEIIKALETARAERIRKINEQLHPEQADDEDDGVGDDMPDAGMFQ